MVHDMYLFEVRNPRNPRDAGTITAARDRSGNEAFQSLGSSRCPLGRNKDRHCEERVATTSSLRAKRSNPSSRKERMGLLRSLRPRNDGSEIESHNNNNESRIHEQRHRPPELDQGLLTIT